MKKPSKGSSAAFINEDNVHFDRFWKQLPDESPMHSLGEDTLRELCTPSDRYTLTKIDPTRKEPHSLLFTEIFSPDSCPFFLALINQHHHWLAKNAPEGLEAYNKQLLKCSANFQMPDERRLGVAAATEYLEAQHQRTATRQQIRKLANENDPQLFASLIGTESRDLFARVEKIYSIKKGPAHRPRK